jgi:hypothetical protein
MAISDILQRLKASPNDPLNWKPIIDDVFAEHERAATTEDRVLLLRIYETVMDCVERNMSEGEDVEQFKDWRRRGGDYASN